MDISDEAWREGRPGICMVFAMQLLVGLDEWEQVRTPERDTPLPTDI